MVMAAEMSALPRDDIERIRTLLTAAGLPTEPPPVDAADMAAAMQLDKKVARGRVRLVLLRSIGDAVLRDDYDDERLRAVLERRVG
jgi:3-dehydroquinate synthase